MSYLRNDWHGRSLVSGLKPGQGRGGRIKVFGSESIMIIEICFFVYNFEFKKKESLGKLNIINLSKILLFY